MLLLKPEAVPVNAITNETIDVHILSISTHAAIEGLLRHKRPCQECSHEWEVEQSSVTSTGPVSAPICLGCLLCDGVPLEGMRLCHLDDTAGAGQGGEGTEGG